jgi:hypothetical protein
MNQLNETVVTDTFFFADTPTHDDGSMGHGGATMVQLYAGKMSQYTHAFPMQWTPNVVFSDNAKVQIGAKVRNILHHYSI